MYQTYKHLLPGFSMYKPRYLHTSIKHRINQVEYIENTIRKTDNTIRGVKHNIPNSAVCENNMLYKLLLVPNMLFTIVVLIN